jgi:ParB family transcriptional regulator, chromosome partitioning protein
MTSARRALRIDDPLAAADACHVARSTTTSTTGRLRDVPLDQIRPNPNQPRRRFDEDSLLALADSIRERGVLQPVIVRPDPPESYELIAGERRWRASRIAGLQTIPSLVDDADDASAIELALIENIARAGLTVIEEARTIASLLDDLNVSRAALARRLGRSRSDLAHSVRLLELPDQAIDLIDSGRLTKGHGKALLTEPDHNRRRDLAHRAVDGDWSVRNLETEIMRGRESRSARPAAHPDHIAAAATLEDTVSRALGIGVQARPYRNGYQLLLDRAARDRLVRLLDPKPPADDRAT